MGFSLDIQLKELELSMNGIDSLISKLKSKNKKVVSFQNHDSPKTNYRNSML